jgi:hypothetical protein
MISAVAGVPVVASVLVGAFACDAPVASAVAGDSVVDANIGILYVLASLMISAVVGVPVVAGVPTVDNIPLTRVSTSFGALLLLALPAVPILSCAAVGPAAVNVPGILLRLKALLLLLYLLLLKSVSF